MEEQIREHRIENEDENTANAEVERMDNEGPREQNQEVQNANAAMGEAMATPLFKDKDAQEFRDLWLSVQAAFVDDPRNSVVKADDLVARVIKSVEENFAAERLEMENQWNQGKDVSTEDLRMMLKRYRSFFDRLLTLKA
jgi:hypothetical protein